MTVGGLLLLLDLGRLRLGCNRRPRGIQHSPQNVGFHRLWWGAFGHLPFGLFSTYRFEDSRSLPLLERSLSIFRATSSLLKFDLQKSGLRLLFWQRFS